MTTSVRPVPQRHRYADCLQLRPGNSIAVAGTPTKGTGHKQRTSAGRCGSGQASSSTQRALYSPAKHHIGAKHNGREHRMHPHTRRPHHGSGCPSRNRPPVGPSSGRVAAHATNAAPSTPRRQHVPAACGMPRLAANVRGAHLRTATSAASRTGADIGWTGKLLRQHAFEWDQVVVLGSTRDPRRSRTIDATRTHSRNSRNGKNSDAAIWRTATT